MADGNPATPKEKIVIGLGIGAFGLYIVLVGLSLLPVPGGPGNLHAPLWVAVCAGLVFFLAGLNIFVQGIGRANADAVLPADSPAWMDVVQYGSVAAIFACLALIGTWIAFVPGERAFSGTFEGLGASAIIGRVAFGVGAIITWLCTLGVVVSAFRRFRRRRTGG